MNAINRMSTHLIVQSSQRSKIEQTVHSQSVTTQNDKLMFFRRVTSLTFTIHFYFHSFSQWLKQLLIRLRLILLRGKLISTIRKKLSLTNSTFRYKHRASYEKSTIYSIVKAAPVLHVAFVDNTGLPMCIPMVGHLEEMEDGETFIYLHGSSVSRFIKVDDGATPMCVTATLVDGYILSLTPYSHDVQYRTAILHCTTFPFDSSYDPDPEAAKMSALRGITNAIAADRWDHSRVPPTKTEMTSTGVLRLRVDTASAKINSAGASDSDIDMKNEMSLDSIWTGVMYV